MSKIIRQGRPEPDPIDELSSDVASLRDEVASLKDIVEKDNESIKDALKEILQILESKSDRDD